MVMDDALSAVEGPVPTCPSVAFGGEDSYTSIGGGRRLAQAFRTNPLLPSKYFWDLKLECKLYCVVGVVLPTRATGAHG
jgi:hypothetical protein